MAECGWPRSYDIPAQIDPPQLVLAINHDRTQLRYARNFYGAYLHAGSMSYFPILDNHIAIAHASSKRMLAIVMP